MLRKISVLLSILILIVVVSGYSQQRKISRLHSTMKYLNCSVCHECINPSKSDPCLKLGKSYFNSFSKKLTPDKLPSDSVMIYKIQDEYEPVKFTHKKHLHMSETLGDCAECHHHSSLSDPFPPCNECHNHDIVLNDLAQVELKGAYHRKCLGCHVEWGKSTDCNRCHKPNGENSKAERKSVPTLLYPKKPGDLIYNTRYFEGPYVKFSHEKHSSIQLLKCADCHAKRNCVGCHYQNIDQPILSTAMERTGVHGTCMYCHDVLGNGTCKKCHSKSREMKID